MLQETILIIILLFFSSLFSGSETALLSLDSIKIKRIQKQGKVVNYLVRLLADPSRFLTTLLIGNMLVNITLSSVLTSLLIKAFGDTGMAISIGLATFLLLVFGEVTPKIFAIKKAEDFAYNISRPLEIFARIISPLRVVFSKISHFMIGSLGIKLEKEPALTQEELKSIIELSHRHGVVREDEKEMIRSVLELTQTSAQEIMTPRPDIKALSLDIEQQQAVDYLKKIKHSKVPVYKDSIDNVVGILYSKDLLFSQEKDYKALIRPAMFVPETKKIDNLLKDFQTQNAKIAIVVDEYGSTYGLVTFEDILEEIVGEIYDEYEAKEIFIEKINEKTFRISGKAPVYIATDELGIKIPQGNYDTIAGYLLFLFKKIPQEGERINKGNISFCIEKLAGRRIKSIILEKL